MKDKIRAVLEKMEWEAFLEEVDKQARISYRQSQSGARGQLITIHDNTDFHVARAAVYEFAKMIEGELDAQQTDANVGQLPQVE
jgi:hypothetical protein